MLQFLLIGAVSTANSKVVTADLERCQLIYRNALSFQSLHTGQSYDLDRETDANNLKSDKLGRKLNTDEFVLNQNLNNASQKIESILSQEFESSPVEKLWRRFGFVQLKWENGVVLYADGTTDEMHLRLEVPVNKAVIIPEITSDNTLDYVKTLLYDKIVDENSMSYGTYVQLVTNCSGIGVQFTFKVDKNKIIYNEKTDKEEFNRNDLKLHYMNIDLSSTYSTHKKGISQSSQQSSVNSKKYVLPYSVGDRVYVIFENGKKCKATILIPGNEQNKIEYNEYCETGFISHKSKGESDWAPNEALIQR